MSRQADDGMGAAMATAGGAILFGFLVLALAVAAIPPTARRIVWFTGMALAVLAAFSRPCLHWPAEGPLTPGATIALVVILWAALALFVSVTFVVMGVSALVIPVATGIGAIVGAAAGAAITQKPSGEVADSLDDFLHNPW